MIVHIFSRQHLAAAQATGGSASPRLFLLSARRGAMSEAELHVMQGRLWSGKLNRARRGELRNGQPPKGYSLNPGSTIVLDPDEHVHSVIDLAFS